MSHFTFGSLNKYRMGKQGKIPTFIWAQAHLPFFDWKYDTAKNLHGMAPHRGPGKQKKTVETLL